MRGYAHVVKQDLVNPDLLFVGTEFGLFISLDGGKQWAPVLGGPAERRGARPGDPPARPGRDHRDARARPLRARRHHAAAEADGGGAGERGGVPRVAALADDATSSANSGSTATASSLGRSPSESAVITYYLKKRHVFGDLKLEVYDAQGKLVATLPGGKRRGINRVEWPMRVEGAADGAGRGHHPEPLRADGAARAGRHLHGEDDQGEGHVLVRRSRSCPDPGSRHSDADRAVQRETARDALRDG